MDAQEVARIARESIEAALKAEDDRRQADATAAAAKQAEIDTAVKSALTQQAKEYAKFRRLPTGDGGEPQGGGVAVPYVTKFGDVGKYDHLTVEDMAFLAGTLDAAKHANRSTSGVSETALKALAIKIAEDKSDLGGEARRDLKAAGIDPADVVNAMKANELDYSTQAGYGDEWVGIEYSRRLWAAIRLGTFVADKLPAVEVPQGSESIYIPLEAADPTWYKVGQATANNGTTGRPDATVSASKLATDRKLLTVGKMGARVVFSEELNEDSLIPWVAQLRQQLETSGSENLEHLIIDGDTEAGATANINTIGGTPGGTELYLVFDGFRKSALVTTTANSRSAGGALADTDFTDTIKLMGPAGLNALDKSKVAFILDLNVNWKVLELASVKTRDVFTNATIENGTLMSIWGYPVFTSAQMHKLSTTNPRKANTAGKVDLTTQANNTTGSILAVRWDQWLLGYKRRMTMKVQELPDADATQIVAVARIGLAQRDTEAVAVSYNCGV